MNEVISKRGALGATQTKDLKNEFRLFHRYIAYNISSHDKRASQFELHNFEGDD